MAPSGGHPTPSRVFGVRASPQGNQKFPPKFTGTKGDAICNICNRANNYRSPYPMTSRMSNTIRHIPKAFQHHLRFEQAQQINFSLTDSNESKNKSGTQEFKKKPLYSWNYYYSPYYYCHNYYRHN